MKTSSTYTATIYVGFRERYTGTVRDIEAARQYIQKVTNEGGLCVTLTPTEFIYKDGSEPGCIVGLINYPRFPQTPEQIRTKATYLADSLMRIYQQLKVSIVFPDETVMLESE